MKEQFSIAHTFPLHLELSAFAYTSHESCWSLCVCPSPHSHNAARTRM